MIMQKMLVPDFNKAIKAKNRHKWPYLKLQKTPDHRNALLVFWSLKPAVSSDRSIPAWQGHKMENT